MTYLDIIKNSNNTFSINSVNEKPPGTLAIHTLNLIEEILKKRIPLSSGNGEFSSLSETEVFRLLQREAEVIYMESTQESAKTELSSQAPKSIQDVQAVFRRIQALHPPPVASCIPIHAGPMTTVLDFLPVTDLRHLALVNREGNKLSKIGELRRARKYGYQGTDCEEAKQYLQQHLPSFSILVKSRLIPDVYLVKNLDNAVSQNNLKNRELDKTVPLNVYADRAPPTRRQGARKNHISGTKPTHSKTEPSSCFDIDIEGSFYNLLNLNLASHKKLKTSLNKALLIYTHQKNLGVIRTLLLLGADPRTRTKNGSYPLHLAAANGSSEGVSLLIQKGADINARNNDQNTALSLAAVNGFTNVASILIQKSADIDAPNEFGDTPLILATRNGRREMMTLLIQEGADINARNNDQNTALSLAALSGLTDVASILIQNGADIEAPNHIGNTPLILATSKGHREMMTRLIQSQANINASNVFGQSALMVASILDKTRDVQLLLRAGADALQQNTQGATARDLAYSISLKFLLWISEKR